MSELFVELIRTPGLALSHEQALFSKGMYQIVEEGLIIILMSVCTWCNMGSGVIKGVAGIYRASLQDSSKNKPWGKDRLNCWYLLQVRIQNMLRMLWYEK